VLSTFLLFIAFLSLFIVRVLDFVDFCLFYLYKYICSYFVADLLSNYQQILLYIFVFYYLVDIISSNSKFLYQIFKFVSFLKIPSSTRFVARFDKICSRQTYLDTYLLQSFVLTEGDFFLHIFIYII